MLSPVCRLNTQSLYQTPQSGLSGKITEPRTVRSQALFSYWLVAFPHRKVGWFRSVLYMATYMNLLLTSHYSVSMDKNHDFSICTVCLLLPQKFKLFLHHQWLFNHGYRCIILSLYGLMACCLVTVCVWTGLKACPAVVTPS